MMTNTSFTEPLNSWVAFDADGFPFGFMAYDGNAEMSVVEAEFPDAARLDLVSGEKRHALLELHRAGKPEPPVATSLPVADSWDRFVLPEPAPTERKPMPSQDKIVECTECSKVMWSNNMLRHWRNAHMATLIKTGNNASLMSRPTDRPLARKQRGKTKSPAKAAPKPKAVPKAVPKPPVSHLRAVDIVQVTIESVIGVGGAVATHALPAVLDFHDAVERFLTAMKP